MTALIFLIFAAIAVLCGISLVAQTHPIASALSLIGVMGSLAVLYLQLGGEFIAMAQMIVYAGAIMVLFIFVIMLLNAGEEEHTNFSKLANIAGIPLAVAIAGFIAATIVHSGQPLPTAAAQGSLTNTKTLSMMIFRDFVYPFELTSFLILVAILGAIVLAQRER
jgi:NADH-quinone oxidoreductase subunit J